MMISISTWALVQCYLNLTLDLVWSVLLISCYCDFPTRMDYNLQFKAQISSSPPSCFHEGIIQHRKTKQSQQAEDFITYFDTINYIMSKHEKY